MNSLQVRLHLLQAICSYISGYSREALILLKKADVEFKILKVPDEVLEEVVAQGIHSDPKSIIPFGNFSYFRLFLRLFFLI